MLCDECCEFTNNYETINANNYCLTCIAKYMLSACPGEKCNNIISLNGFNDLDDIEDYICTFCDTVYCNNCIIRERNIIICKECLLLDNELM